MFIKVHPIGEGRTTMYKIENEAILNTSAIVKVEKFTNDALESFKISNEDKETLNQFLGEARMKESPSLLELFDGSRMKIAESIPYIWDLLSK